jgi:hypothetical protein
MDAKTEEYIRERLGVLGEEYRKAFEARRLIDAGIAAERIDELERLQLSIQDDPEEPSREPPDEGAPRGPRP